MIAVVSSTLFPGQAPLYGSDRSVYSHAERLDQTRGTVQSLVEAGLRDVYVADNSPAAPDARVIESLAPASVHHFRDQYQFHNKGISELFLLLLLVESLPGDQPILKVSGRYRLLGGVELSLDGADVAAKWDERNRGISTRCYLVRNRDVYRRFLEDTLSEVYGQAARIRGPRSLLRIVKNSLAATNDHTRYFDPNDSIEQASARALRRPSYRVRRLPALGITGEVAISRDVILE